MRRDFERSASFLARYRRLSLTFHPTAAQSFSRMAFMVALDITAYHRPTC
jgi:hypothetical protein